jgi:hypothetical protein
MPLESAMGERSGLLSHAVWLSQQEEKGRKRDYDDDDDSPELTEEEKEKFKIVRYCANLYDDARKAREPYETFDIAWDLYIGNVWPTKWPSWRAKITVNKIRSFITFMQAVMTDNKPRIMIEPTVPGSEDAADLLKKLVDRDWDENNMQEKLSQFVLFGLIWGTAFMKITYDPYGNGGRGKHLAAPIVPYRIFTNRTATCIEDAEYVIHVEEQTMGWVRRNFPTQARAAWGVRGMRIGKGRDRDRDYIREGDINETERIISAQNVNGNISAPQWTSPGPEYMDEDGDTVEVCEYWLRDDSLEMYERPKYVNGKPKMEPVIGADGEYELEIVGRRAEISEIDGMPFIRPIRKAKMKPVMETAWREKFPNGRLVMIAGGRILLRDIPVPFQTDGFPFAMWKDYNVGAFWGQGETMALKDCAVALNRIVSQVYDILEKTGNPSFKLRKGSGVNAASIKNKPGSIIAMDDMDALAPLEKPPIPPQFLELYGIIGKAMGEVSGVNDAVTGALPASNTAFATMDQLQESGAAPIRLKVRNLESGINRIGKLRVALIQQFDNGQRPLRRPDHEREVDEEGAVVEPSSATHIDWQTYGRKDLQGSVEFGVVPISSLSSSPAGLWNKWMQMYDKHLIDRRWWHDKQRIEGYRTELPRMERQEAADKAQEMAAQASKGKGKPGPAQSSNPTRRHKAPQPQHNNTGSTRQQR